METVAPPTDERSQAIASLKRKQAFRAHAITYVVVNMLLVAIWALTGADYFWPIWVILGWGIGLGANAWDVYGRKPLSEEEIQREAERLRGVGGPT